MTIQMDKKSSGIEEFPQNVDTDWRTTCVLSRRDGGGVIPWSLTTRSNIIETVPIQANPKERKRTRYPERFMPALRKMGRQSAVRIRYRNAYMLRNAN